MTMIEKVSLALNRTGPCTCSSCLKRRARLAIEAMREPTDAMDDAGYKVWSDGTGGYTVKIWKAKRARHEEKALQTDQLGRPRDHRVADGAYLSR